MQVRECFLQLRISIFRKTKQTIDLDNTMHAYITRIFANNDVEIYLKGDSRINNDIEINDNVELNYIKKVVKVKRKRTATGKITIWRYSF